MMQPAPNECEFDLPPVPVCVICTGNISTLENPIHRRPFGSLPGQWVHEHCINVREAALSALSPAPEDDDR